MTSEELAMTAKTIVANLDLQRGTWVKACDPTTFEARTLAAKFAGYLPEKVFEAAVALKRDMERGNPTPDDVLVKLRGESAVKSGLRNPTTCNHPAPWGFVIEDGKRIAFCRYCYSEWDAPNVRTEDEIESEKRARGVPI